MACDNGGYRGTGPEPPDAARMVFTQARRGSPNVVVVPHTPSLQWPISEWPGFVCIFHVFFPRGGHDGHYADRFFFIRCRQGHNGFIHWTNGRNEAAVSQKRFLQIKSLHPAGHQIHSDAPGDCAGTARTSSLNVCRFCGGKVIDTIPCQSPPA